MEYKECGGARLKVMMKNENLLATSWKEYELLDSGENMKLERYGNVVLARPETQALWKKRHPELWEDADATFAWRDAKGGWKIKKSLPESWELSWGSVRFVPKLTGFKHTGVFPEQSPNWQWIQEQVAPLQKPNVLNLFGYTGVASLVAAKAGAFVTHVDASKQSLDWAHENAKRSGLSEDTLRWIPDDALAFAKREVRRGATYDGIILDPPAFGRGTKGEVWRVEDGLPKLMEAVAALLSDTKGSFFLLNGYAAGYAPRSFAQSVEDTFANIDGTYGELHIPESDSSRVVPSGIYVRFSR